MYTSVKLSDFPALVDLRFSVSRACEKPLYFSQWIELFIGTNPERLHKWPLKKWVLMIQDSHWGSSANLAQNRKDWDTLDKELAAPDTAFENLMDFTFNVEENTGSTTDPVIERGELEKCFPNFSQRIRQSKPVGRSRRTILKRDQTQIDLLSM